MANDFVKLSVGGILYTTSKATLTRYPDSLLGAMFTGSVPCTQDDDGCFLIDRDGQIFRHVLNFLRCGKLVLPNSFDEHDLLLSEADFYLLTPLVNAIQDYLRAKETEKPEKDDFPFYSVMIYFLRSRLDRGVVSGTIESLLQLPYSLLHNATRETLRRQVPDSTIFALRIFMGLLTVDFNSAGWTFEGEQASDIIGLPSCDYDLSKQSEFSSPSLYLKRRS